MTSGMGLEWDLRLHEAQIEDRGTPIIHETGVKCPCQIEDTLATHLEPDAPVSRRIRRVDCDQCLGEGWFYRNPRRLVCIVTGVMHDRNLTEAGWVTPGDMALSPPPGLDPPIADEDRVTATWEQAFNDGQVIVRNAGRRGTNITRKLNLAANEDRLWYHATRGLFCEDANGNTYADGTDYQMDGGRVIRWVGNRPPDGIAYVVKYMAYFEWICWRPPQVRFEKPRFGTDPLDLGYRVMLRRLHVAHPADDSKASPEDRLSLNTRLSC